MTDSKDTIEREKVDGLFETELATEVQSLQSDYPDRVCLPVPISALKSFNDDLYNNVVQRPSDSLPVLNSVLRFSDAHSAAHLPGVYAIPQFDEQTQPRYPADIPAQRIGTIAPVAFQAHEVSEQLTRPYIAAYRCNACESVTERESLIAPTDEPFECSNCGRATATYEVDSEHSHFAPEQGFEAVNTADVMKNISNPRSVQANAVGHAATPLDPDTWYHATAFVGATRDDDQRFSVTLTVLYTEEIDATDHRQWIDTQNKVREFTAEELLFSSDHNMEFEQKLWGFADHVDHVFDAQGPDTMSEEDLRAKILLPLVDLFGWDVFSDTVRLEYGGDVDDETGQLDVALLPDGETAAVAIEAKRPEKPVAEKAQRQLKNYMVRNDIEWGLLSNGHKFELLHKDTACYTAVSTTYDGLQDKAAQLRVLQHSQFNSQ